MSLKVVIVASFLFLIVAANRQSGLRIRPAQDDEDVEAEWCIEDPFLTDRSFESCNFFYGCDEFNRWILFSCEEDRPIYDSLKFECGRFIIQNSAISSFSVPNIIIAFYYLFIKALSLTLIHHFCSWTQTYEVMKRFHSRFTQLELESCQLSCYSLFCIQLSTTKMLFATLMNFRLNLKLTAANVRSKATNWFSSPVNIATSISFALMVNRG